MGPSIPASSPLADYPGADEERPTLTEERRRAPTRVRAERAHDPLGSDINAIAKELEE